MQLKQRRKKDKAPPDPAPAAAPTGGIDTAVVLKHARRLTLITVVCSLPYVVQQGYLWLHLRSGLLRPGVPIHGLRQILIVGTQSAGTTQTSEWLQELGADGDVQNQYGESPAQTLQATRGLVAGHP